MKYELEKRRLMGDEEVIEGRWRDRFLNHNFYKSIVKFTGWPLCTEMYGFPKKCPKIYGFFCVCTEMYGFRVKS